MNGGNLQQFIRDAQEHGLRGEALGQAAGKYADYEQECYESGEVPCIDTHGHSWTVSDEDDNICYCNKCGCSEY
jgi:hypothetical protein